MKIEMHGVNIAKLFAFCKIDTQYISRSCLFFQVLRSMGSRYVGVDNVTCPVIDPNIAPKRCPTNETCCPTGGGGGTEFDCCPQESGVCCGYIFCASQLCSRTLKINTSNTSIVNLKPCDETTQKITTGTTFTAAQKGMPAT